MPENTEVWISSSGERVQGRIISPANMPRSYLVETPSGTIRRNRRHLNLSFDPLIEPAEVEPHQESNDPEPSELPRRVTRSQTGTLIKPPDRLA